MFVDIHNEMILEDDQQSHHNYLLYRIIKYLCYYWNIIHSISLNIISSSYIINKIIGNIGIVSSKIKENFNHRTFRWFLLYWQYFYIKKYLLLFYLSLFSQIISFEGSVKLRKIYEINWKILLKLSTEHNMKVEYTYYLILKLTGPFWIFDLIEKLTINKNRIYNRILN